MVFFCKRGVTRANRRSQYTRVCACLNYPKTADNVEELVSCFVVDDGSPTDTNDGWMVNEISESQRCPIRWRDDDDDDNHHHHQHHWKTFWFGCHHFGANHCVYLCALCGCWLVFVGGECCGAVIMCRNRAHVSSFEVYMLQNTASS